MQKAPMGGICVFLIYFIYSVSVVDVFRLCLIGVALRSMPLYIFKKDIKNRNSCFSRALKMPNRL